MMRLNAKSRWVILDARKGEPPPQCYHCISGEWYPFFSPDEDQNRLILSFEL
jgi:hypothetical protein